MNNHDITIKANKRLIGPIIFIVLSIVFLYSVVSNTPKILVLHSYDNNYIWTNLIDKTLAIGFKKRQYLRHKIYYMNSKYQYNASTELSADKVIAQYDPDVIIAIDDNAQYFLSKRHLDTGINIVFAGINGSVDKYHYQGKKNVTGIFERKPILGILFVLNALNTHNQTAHKKNVTFLLDGSNSNQKDKHYLLKQDWNDFNFDTYKVKTFAQWQQFILSLDEKNIDYLLVSGYRKLSVPNNTATPKYADYKTVVNWTQANSTVPIIALNVFSAKDGFALAVGSSSFEQANTALELVDKILLEKTAPADIAFVSPHLYSIGINKTALKQLQYKIPIFIQSFAESAHNVYE